MHRTSEAGLNDEIYYMIKMEKDALHAMNLSRLLTKNWIEYQNSYKICSRIPAKDQKRVMDILGDNRYQ